MSGAYTGPADPGLNLNGRCSHCGGQHGFLTSDFKGHTEYLCRPCARQQALWESGYRQLNLRVREVIDAWAAVWGDVEGIGDIPELLEWIGNDYAREHIQSAKP